jgi:uncharacterized protein (TIGR03905 family)
MTVYKTKGTCSSEIRIDLDGKQIRSIDIVGGCDGNSKGLMSMLKGCDANETITRLEGITCGRKRTSCPDQIAKALRLALSEEAI